MKIRAVGGAILGAVLLCGAYPAAVSAASFATQSVFLSKSPATEGEVVRIFAVVSNDTSYAFSGTVAFTDSDSKVGSVSIDLSAGEAQTVSVSWKPAAGTRAIVAKLQSKDGTVVGEQSAAFIILKKQDESSSSQTSAAVESSEGIQQRIADFLPGTAQASAPLFQMIDSARASSAGVIDNQITSTKGRMAKTSTAQKGSVEGAETSTLPDPINSFWSILNTLYLYLLTVVRFIIGNAGVFYPVLAFAFLYVLWRMFRRFRRPAY